ncbi:MAG: hypothetical protein OXU63_07310 [Acidobacteriota bacterium]|nr:hypothetical protein [Acidobacteriota bacterium]
MVDYLINGEVGLIVNTPLGGESYKDDMEIRTTALKFDIPCVTTISGAMAAVDAVEALRESLLQVTALQDLATRSLAGCKAGV